MERIIMNLACWICDCENPSLSDKVLAVWTICISLPLGTLIAIGVALNMVSP